MQTILRRDARLGGVWQRLRSLFVRLQIGAPEPAGPFWQRLASAGS
jgi:hypothetical protein